jgi:serine/threonine protein kinase
MEEEKTSGSINRMELLYLIGQILDDKYYVENLLGKGGMGAIYRAIHLGTKRPVALKIITPLYMNHPESVERFKREAEAAGRLCHPNVVNVTDFGFAELQEKRVAYLVMEYLQGCTLKEFLEKKGALPLNQVVDLVEQISIAIHQAHHQGIIHRDLKPSNIWLEPNGRKGYHVKVLDFGIAKLGEPYSSELSKTTTSLSFKEIHSKDTTVILKEELTSQNLNTPALKRSSLEKSSQENLVDTLSEPTSLAPSPLPPVVPLFPVLDKEFQFIAEKLAIPEDVAVTKTMNKEDLKQVLRYTQDDCGSNDDTSLKEITQAGAFIGTPLYMSPEQCAGRALDPRSDLYSLGLMTYQMLTNEHPFKTCHVSTFAMLSKHLHTKPEELNKKRPDLSEWTSEVVMSAFHPEIEKRPRDVLVFAHALKASSKTWLELLQGSVTLYSQHFFLFSALSLFAYSLASLGLLSIFLCTLIPELQTTETIIGMHFFFFTTDVKKNPNSF